MSRRPAHEIEPRLLSRDMAARYCGLSVPIFESECPVIPVRIRTRVLYDRAAIDAWLDSLTPKPAQSSPGDRWLGKLDDADARAGN
jgi:hypothetical protein